MSLLVNTTINNTTKTETCLLFALIGVLVTVIFSDFDPQFTRSVDHLYHYILFTPIALTPENYKTQQEYGVYRSMSCSTRSAANQPVAFPLYMLSILSDSTTTQTIYQYTLNSSMDTPVV